MKRITKISTVVVAGALALSGLASTAEATSAKTTGTTMSIPDPVLTMVGRCTASAHNYGSFKAYFINVPGAKSFYRFSWYFLGPELGHKNDIVVLIRKDVPNGPDTTTYKYVSGDNLAPGYGEYSLPRRHPAIVSIRDLSHFDVTLTFDRSGWDPICHMRMPSF